jgi:hypothetical protein
MVSVQVAELTGAITPFVLAAQMCAVIEYAHCGLRPEEASGDDSPRDCAADALRTACILCHHRGMLAPSVSSAPHTHAFSNGDAYQHAKPTTDLYTDEHADRHSGTDTDAAWTSPRSGDPSWSFSIPAG